MEDIYLDHAATTPIDKQVSETMYLISNQIFGNPSSVHSFGRKARQYLDEARRVVAQSISSDEKEIIFTSGGTEAINLALLGVAMANKAMGNHIITTNQEHHATLHTANYLERIGFDVTYLPTNEQGDIRIDDLKNALTDKTILVSIMFVNNETGVIHPIEEIGKHLKGHQAYFHTDAVQAFGLLNINVKEMDIDMLTVSSHKINGPKGIGFLYVSSSVKINAIQFGGEQERRQRPGTENIVGIAGFQKAVELAIENKHNRKKSYQMLKDLFLRQLTKRGIKFELNGDVNSAVASIVNISFPGAHVETLLTNLDLEGIAASSGSACTAGSIEPSHVLSAMFGEESDRTKNSIRFSFGMHNTAENITEAANRITKIITRLTG